VGAYLEVLVKYRWLIVTTTLSTCVVATVLTLLMPSSYVASATLRVVASAQGGSIDNVDYRYADRLMNTYVAILKSRPIVKEASRRVGLDSGAGQEQMNVTVEAVRDTELMRVSVEHTNPTLAQDMANALAGLMIEEGEALYSGGGMSAREILEEQLEIINGDLEEDRTTLYSLMNSSSADYSEIDALNSRIILREETYATLLRQYEQARVAEAMRAGSISVVEPAIEPSGPSKPNKKLNIALGALVGLGGGVGLAFLLENLQAQPALRTLFSLRRKVME